MRNIDPRTYSEHWPQGSLGHCIRCTWDCFTGRSTRLFEACFAGACAAYLVHGANQDSLDPLTRAYARVGHDSYRVCAPSLLSEALLNDTILHVYVHGAPIVAGLLGLVGVSP